jgi:hypothetical protein
MKSFSLLVFLNFTIFQIKAQTLPEIVVQKQLEAYNARDLKAFVATYADSVEIYNFNNQKLMVKGKAEVEKQWGALFEQFPKNYAALRGRIVQGNFVIDKEFVTGRTGQNDFEATAIYEVRNGLIHKVWFVQ